MSYAKRTKLFSCLVAIFVIKFCTLSSTFAQTEPVVECSPTPCIASEKPNNSSGGIFFDLTAETKDIYITRIEFYSRTGNVREGQFQIYSRPGSYVDFTSSADGWVAGSIQNSLGGNIGFGYPHTYNMDDLLIPAGQTFGFFLGTDTTVYDKRFPYRNEEIFISNGEITLFSDLAKYATNVQGTVLDHLNSDNFASSRSFSGIIHYRFDNSSCYVAVTKDGKALTFCL